MTTRAFVVVLSSVLLFFSREIAAGAAQDARPAELPANIQVSELLRPVVVELLRKSETFRRQASRLARRIARASS